MLARTQFTIFHLLCSILAEKWPAGPKPNVWLSPPPHQMLRRGSLRPRFSRAGEGWRNVVDLHHLPKGTHCLANRPGSLVRLAFPTWSAWQDLHLQPSRFERDASSLGYTRMVPTVGFAPTLCAF